jgi:hypothetical protein
MKSSVIEFPHVKKPKNDDFSSIYHKKTALRPAKKNGKISNRISQKLNPLSFSLTLSIFARNTSLSVSIPGFVKPFV